ncbi:retrotransposon protein, putative, ty1-copia subclass, partial [Tanacetum coccineum]
MEQMTSICDMVGQYMQKKEEEKRIVEEQAGKEINPILEEFVGELAHIDPIPPGIVEADFDPNDDTSSGDDSFENIEYVDASPSYSELNNSDSFLEETDTSLSHLDNSLPEFETFSNHTEETRSGSTTTHANYSLPDNGIYEIDMINHVPNVNSIYTVSNKRAKHNLDSTYLWHYRLAHISKKHIEKLQHDGLLKSTDEESFDKCDYALETATRILNMVLTKKVDRTPYELWYRKVPNLSYLKDTQRKQWITISTSHLKIKLLLQGMLNSWRKIFCLVKLVGGPKNLKKIQDEDTSPFENTSEISIEVEGFEPPQEEVVPIHIYMVQPEGFIDPKHPRKVYKLQRSIYGLKQASRSWNKRFDAEGIKRFGFAQNLDEPCVASEAAMEAVWIRKFISGL